MPPALHRALACSLLTAIMMLGPVICPPMWLRKVQAPICCLHCCRCLQEWSLTVVMPTAGADGAMEKLKRRTSMARATTDSKRAN